MFNSIRNEASTLMNPKMLEVITSSKLFAGIQADEIPGLLTCLLGKENTYQKGQFIYHSGDTTSNVGMVLSGSVHLIREDYWGNRTILSEVLPGDLFGEAYASLRTESIPVSCIAPENCSILFLDISKIITVCSSACHYHTRLIQNLLMVMAQKNVSLTQKLDHMSKRSTRDKLLSYLSAQALKSKNNNFTISFNRQQLADYLCVDRSAMSNELSKLRDEGILTFHKNDFTLSLDYSET